ncbi:MAG: DUF983 domain-containing protein [Pseudomonadota bacterium]
MSASIDNTADTSSETLAGDDGAPRSWVRALWRGARRRCPHCGEGRLFYGYTRVNDHCPSCGLEFSGHRADDAPPYITIMIVGHVAIPLALAWKQFFDPPLALQFLALTPAMLLATAWLLPVSKGAMIGVQWANRLHGFGDDPDT